MLSWHWSPFKASDFGALSPETGCWLQLGTKDIRIRRDHTQLPAWKVERSFCLFSNQSDRNKLRGTKQDDWTPGVLFPWLWLGLICHSETTLILSGNTDFIRGRGKKKNLTKPILWVSQCKTFPWNSPMYIVTILQKLVPNDACCFSKHLLLMGPHLSKGGTVHISLCWSQRHNPGDTNKEPSFSLKRLPEVKRGATWG